MNETGPIPFLRSLDRLSLAGSRVNEDGTGLRGRFAWIVDGATGLSDEPLTPAGSDASWLAHAIGERLTELSVGTGAGALLNRLEDELRTAFEAATAHVTEIVDHHAPSACLGLIEAGPGENGGIGIRGRFLGDVVALVPTRERGRPVDRRAGEALRAADPGGPRAGARAGQPCPRPCGARSCENRTRLNRPDGYWVGQSAPALGRPRADFRGSDRAGAAIVLATDGFMRLVDVFGAYTDVDAACCARCGQGSGTHAGIAGTGAKRSYGRRLSAC